MVPHSSPVLFIVGPTASGKSALALELAKRLGGEIISADSMQVYRGMDIGTAKPSKEERARVPHHLLDILPPSKSFSAFEYRKLALEKIREIVRRGKLPIVAGGSGLYVRALLRGLDERPGGNPRLRRRLEAEIKRKGLASVFRRLEKADPAAAAKVDSQNARRVIRALEIWEARKKKKPGPFASLRMRPSCCHPEEAEGRRRISKQSLRALGFEPVVVGILKDRAELYAAIHGRVEEMFRRGLADEVRRLSKKKLSVTARQAIGYKEILAALKKGVILRPKAEESRSFAQAFCSPRRGSLRMTTTEPVSPVSSTDIMKATRRFAKRQMTWFKREEGIRWVLWPAGAAVSDIADRVGDHLK